MEFMQYRVYYTHLNEEKEICKFWIDESGDVDEDNLPGKKEISHLLQTLRLRDVHVEFTGRIEDD